MKCLKKYGIAREDCAGGPFKIKRYSRVRNLKQAQRAIQDAPVPACFRCYQSLFHCDGTIKLPSAEDSLIGHHAMTLIGMDDVGFKVVNSWGADWGINGVAVLPFEIYDKMVAEAWKTYI
jgi:hypothetical protein